MFFAFQDEHQRLEYIQLLKAIGSLSKLFNDNTVPYLGYRVSENIFCRAFQADNLSRSDCSADAAKTTATVTTGIGIKTFLEGNGQSFQKVAEFNRARSELQNLSPRPFVEAVSALRNERIRSTKSIHGLNGIMYHCILRSEHLYKIHEQPMDLIHIDLIQDIEKKSSKNTITFNDTFNEYSFNLSKSTLYKRFYSTDRDYAIDIAVFEDPYEIIKNLFSEYHGPSAVSVVYPSILLPLYSARNRLNPRVPERSGLNQWNADGRPRNEDELYIPIPSWIHDAFPGFLPPRDEPFDLKLPNHETLLAKVCQDNSKALMSSPNKALGHWILRDVLNIPPGELVTYQDLVRINIDSVELTKQDDHTFLINFRELGSFADFEQQHR